MLAELSVVASREEDITCIPHTTFVECVKLKMIDFVVRSQMITLQSDEELANLLLVNSFRSFTMLVCPIKFIADDEIKAPLV
jgi:hypothetical protein